MQPTLSLRQELMYQQLPSRHDPGPVIHRDGVTVRPGGYTLTVPHGFLGTIRISQDHLGLYYEMMQERPQGRITLGEAVQKVLGQDGERQRQELQRMRDALQRVRPFWAAALGSERQR